MGVWGIPVPCEGLSTREWEYLAGLPKGLPTVEWVWREMDRVWLQSRLDNRLPLAGQPIDLFYRHPVWLMNGIFTAADPVSRAHRLSIARHIVGSGAQSVADFGGGFGELARAVVQIGPSVEVCIVEPYPSPAATERLKVERRVRFVPELSGNRYDLVVAQDVLEHVEDPIGLAWQLSGAVKPGGQILFANCFYPVIMCHLPRTFHLRHTFPYVMKALGLRLLGSVQGAVHAMAFGRPAVLDLARARRVERLSRSIGPLLNQGTMSARQLFDQISRK